MNKKKEKQKLLSSSLAAAGHDCSGNVSLLVKEV